MNDLTITSKQNPKIKALLNLRKPRARQNAGVTLLEGFEELSLAFSAGIKPATLYFCTELMGVGQTDFLKKFSNDQKISLSKEVFEKVAYRESPDGWLAVVPALKASLNDIKISSKNPLILVCEAVEKPGNLGAILRTADAAGVDAVIATEAATDWGNPNIIRSSKGAVFSMPVASATNDELLSWLKKHKITTIAATPSATQVYTQTDMTKPTAILVGTEKQGLSHFWLKNADQKVLIPMQGKVDSLNVATSAALLIYEAVCQRA